jgi:hypothetical protein
MISPFGDTFTLSMGIRGLLSVDRISSSTVKLQKSPHGNLVLKGEGAGLVRVVDADDAVHDMVDVVGRTRALFAVSTACAVGDRRTLVMPFGLRTSAAAVKQLVWPSTSLQYSTVDSGWSSSIHLRICVRVSRHLRNAGGHTQCTFQR